MSSAFPLGTKVIIHGLSHHTHLNGTVAVVEGWLPDHERLQIRCASGQKLGCRLHNVSLMPSGTGIVQPPTPPPPPEMSLEDPAALRALVLSQQQQITELRALVHLLIMDSKQPPQPHAQGPAPSPPTPRWQPAPPSQPAPRSQPAPPSQPPPPSQPLPSPQRPAAAETDVEDELPGWLLAATEQLRLLSEDDDDDRRKAAGSSATESIAAADDEEKELPSGWQRVWSSEHGRAYYHHTERGLSTWAHPEWAPSDAAAGAGVAAVVGGVGRAVPSPEVEEAAWATHARLEAWAQDRRRGPQPAASCAAPHSNRERERERRAFEQHGEVLRRARHAWAMLDMEARAKFEDRHRGRALPGNVNVGVSVGVSVGAPPGPCTDVMHGHGVDASPEKLAERSSCADPHPHPHPHPRPTGGTSERRRL